MDKTMENIKEKLYELHLSLILECSREDAKQYGTLKEWKKINRRVLRLEQAARKMTKSISDVSKNKEDILDDKKHALLCMLPFVLIIVRFGVLLGCVCLVYYFLELIVGKPFSFITALVACIIIQLLYNLLSKR